jgi:hypothetical protein
MVPTTRLMSIHAHAYTHTTHTYIHNTLAATIPDAIKAEMLERIRKFVEAHQNPVSKMPEPAAKSTEATQQK